MVRTMSPFYALLFEDRAGNIFFAHGWVAYNPTTIKQYEKDFKPDFKFVSRVGIRRFDKPFDFTEAISPHGNRSLYIIEGPMLEAAKQRAEERGFIVQEKCLRH